MKLNKKILITAFAAIGLLACSKNNDGPKSNGEVDVTVTIESVVSRAVVDPTVDEYQTKIKEAYAYVVDFNGTVMASGKFTDGERTKTFTGLTSNVKDVFVIANWPSTFTPSSIGNGNVLNDITLSMADLKPEYDDDDADDPDDLDTHGVKYATLYNVSSTTPAKTDVGGDNETWTFDITLAPVVTRFEIGQVSGIAEISNDQKYSGLISYTLSGIYMNNVYQSVKLDAKTVLTHTGSKLVSTFNQTEFPAAHPSWACDSYADEFEDGLTYSPVSESAELWAYHVAPINASVAANKDDTPQIILHLTDVYFGETEPGKYPSTLTNLYVPVNGFKDATSKTAIENFKRGEVYKILDLEFNSTHVKPDVDPSDITVIAKVKVQGWKVNTVLPEF